MEPQHYPCQALNPDNTCPELRTAWGRIMFMDERLEKYEGTRVKFAVDFIEMKGLWEEFEDYTHGQC